MALPKLSTLSECPHCGYDEFYQQQPVKGHIYPRRRFDGGDTENTGLLDSISFGNVQKTVYCGQCQEKIAIDDTNETPN